MKLRFILPILLAAAAAQTNTTPAADKAVAVANEPGHHLAIENEYIRAFKVEVAPKASTLLHRHDHDYIFVSIGDAEVENTVEGKSPVQLKLANGEARFVPGNFAHVARNLSDRPFRNITVELLRPDAKTAFPEAANSPAQKLLFVKDGVRATEVHLAPGATIPRHEHSAPHLLMAVSDLDLRSDVEGQGPMPGKFKAGEIKWLPGGYAHTLTNTGTTEAHFVTLEF